MDGVFAGFGLALILFIFVISIVTFVFCVWVFIDAAKRPEHEWQAAGQNKILWLVILGGSWFVGIPFIAGLVYVFWPRPALTRAHGGHFSGPPSNSGYGY